MNTGAAARVRRSDLTKPATKPRATSGQRLKPNAPLNRRDAAVAAAMEVLARHGARGLTHRQVDRHLHWPLGSTSNYFRTRNEILIAIADHIVNLDSADLKLEADAASLRGMNLVSFTERIVQLMTKWMHPGYRNRMLVGAEILFESTRNPEVLQAIRQTIGVNVAWYQRVFEQLGSIDPVASAKLFAFLMSSTYVGVCIAKDLPDADQLRALVHGWVVTSLTQVAAPAAVEHAQAFGGAAPMHARD